MAQALPVASGLVIPGREIHESASRAGGPGGQHVNKTSTRVTLRWNVETSEVLSDAQRRRLRRRLASRLTRRGALVVHADATRSRTRNRALARERLAALVREGLATRRPRRATRPGAAARARRVQAKRRRSAIKQRRGRVRDED
jgi:ribosome-associated protein